MVDIKLTRMVISIDDATKIQIMVRVSDDVIRTQVEAKKSTRVPSPV